MVRKFWVACRSAGFLRQRGVYLPPLLNLRRVNLWVKPQSGVKCQAKIENILESLKRSPNSSDPPRGSALSVLFRKSCQKIKTPASIADRCFFIPRIRAGTEAVPTVVQNSQKPNLKVISFSTCTLRKTLRKLSPRILLMSSAWKPFSFRALVTLSRVGSLAGSSNMG